jgi:hypothetical protein
MSAVLAERLLAGHVARLRDPLNKKDLEIVQAYSLGASRDMGEARDALQSLSEILLHPAGWNGRRNEAFDLDLIHEVGTTSRAVVHRMLLACWARIKLDMGSPISTRELAAILGLSLRRAQALAADAGILAGEGRNREIHANEARRWLAKQGVIGFVGLYDEK